MSDHRVAGAQRGLVHSWRGLSFEQRVAAVGALLLIVSTFGPFSFVEAAEVLVALGVLALLRARGQGSGSGKQPARPAARRRPFELPFGDGGVIAAAGAWAGLLIAIRVFDRPLGLNLLALACAAILVIAGLSERAKRPPPELGTDTWDLGPEARGDPPPPVRPPPPGAPDEAKTEPLAPPEFDPAAPSTSAGRRHDQAEDG